MNKYISVIIPTKRYIREFLISEYGEKIILPKRSLFGNKLYDLLSRSIDENERKIDTNFNCEMKIYVSLSTFYHRGILLSNRSIKDFNNLIESEIKNRFRTYMDFLIQIDPSFVKNLPVVREKLRLDLEAWDFESIKKDYYRYRKRIGKPLLYKK